MEMLKFCLKRFNTNTLGTFMLNFAKSWLTVFPITRGIIFQYFFWPLRRTLSLRKKFFFWNKRFLFLQTYLNLENLKNFFSSRDIDEKRALVRKRKKLKIRIIKKREKERKHSRCYISIFTT